MQHWYTWDGTEQRGPYSEAEIRQTIERIPLDVLVSNGGDWIPVQSSIFAKRSTEVLSSQNEEAEHQSNSSFVDRPSRPGLRIAIAAAASFLAIGIVASYFLSGPVSQNTSAGGFAGAEPLPNKFLGVWTFNSCNFPAVKYERDSMATVGRDELGNKAYVSRDKAYYLKTFPGFPSAPFGKDEAIVHQVSDQFVITFVENSDGGNMWITGRGTGEVKQGKLVVSKVQAQTAKLVRCGVDFEIPEASPPRGRR